MTAAVAVVTLLGGAFLIGHIALSVMLPLIVVVLFISSRQHLQPFPLWLAILALLIGYIHIFAGTPEWTLVFVMAANLLGAFLDWRANRTRSAAPVSRPLPVNL